MSDTQGLAHQPLESPKAPEVRLLASLIEKAGSAYAAGDLNASLSFYDQAVLIDPTNNVLYANRSAILLKLGRSDEALSEANHAIQLKPTWSKAFYRKAEALKELRQYEAAVVAYCQALVKAETEQFRAALVQCAQLSAIKESFAKNLERLQGTGLAKNTFVVISLVGQEFLGAARHEVAITLLKMALDVDSPSLKLKQSTLGALAHAYYMSGNLRKAMDYLELQLELAVQMKDAPLQMSVHGYISNMAAAQGEIRLAIIHRRNHIALQETCKHSTTDARRSLAELYLATDDAQQAEIEFKLVLAGSPNNFGALMGLGKALLAQNQPTAAISFFSRCEMLADDQQQRVEALINRCNALTAAGSVEKAIGIIKTKAIEWKLDEESELMGKVFGFLCACHQSSGEWDTSRTYAKKQLSLGLSRKSVALQIDALHYLSSVHVHFGDTTNAIRLLERQIHLIERSPGLAAPAQHCATLCRLGELYADKGESERSLQALRKRLTVAEKCGSVLALMEAHSDLAKTYGRLGDHTSQKKHIESELNILRDDSACCSDKLEWIYLEDSGDLHSNTGQHHDALECLQNALMLIQEVDNPAKEAELCRKIGAIHFRLGRDEEAIVYYQQFLSISRQLKRLKDVVVAYSALGDIYVKMRDWDSALECYRFQVSVARILNDQRQKLSGMMGIGKTLAKREEWSNAIKVFARARRYAEGLHAKRELALCYGYLGECHLALDNRRKALAYYCKQLPLFPYVNDVEGKCETIRHLIEEKKANGDLDWCEKLCRMREEVVRSGPHVVQISVLREAACAMQEIGRLNAAIHYAQKALNVSLESQADLCSSIDIVLRLCDLYDSNNMRLESTHVLSEFIYAQEGLADSILVEPLYRLVKYLLDDGEPGRVLRVLEGCDFSATEVDSQLFYAHACGYFRMENTEEASIWLDKFERMKGRRALDRLLLSPDEKSTNEVVREYPEAALLQQCLDYLNGYEYLQPDTVRQLYGRSRIHAAMSRFEWATARDMLLSEDESLDSSIDRLMASFFVEIDTGEPYQYFSADVPSNELRLLPYNWADMTRLRVCLVALHNSHRPLVALQAAEDFIVRSCTTVPDGLLPVEALETELRQRRFLVYRFTYERYSLIWTSRCRDGSESSCEKGIYLQMFYTVSCDTSRLTFYEAMVSAILQRLQVPLLCDTELEEMLRQTSTVVGCLSGISDAEHLPCLLALECPSCDPDREDYDTVALTVLLGDETILPLENAIVNVFTEKGGPIPPSAVRALPPARVLILTSLEAIHPSDFKLYTVRCEVILYVVNEELVPKTEKLFALSRSAMASGVKCVVVHPGTTESLPEAIMQILLGTSSQTQLTVRQIRSLFSGCGAVVFGRNEQPLDFTCPTNMLRNILRSTPMSTLLQTTQSTICGSVDVEVRRLLEKATSIFRELRENERNQFMEMIRSYTPAEKLKEMVAEESNTDYYNSTDMLFKRLIRLAYADNLFEPMSGASEGRGSVDVRDLAKAFEVRRRKWRRRPKGHRSSSRGYCSEGDDRCESAASTNFSDKDLTDTESVSGARVVGIDTADEDQHDGLFSYDD